MITFSGERELIRQMITPISDTIMVTGILCQCYTASCWEDPDCFSSGTTGSLSKKTLLKLKTERGVRFRAVEVGENVWGKGETVAIS